MVGGFRISEKESVKESIVRILTEQVDSILRHCHDEQENVHVSIHEIRKSIKRIRAVLRLVRDEIGYSTYFRENVFYRDLSRSISDLRTYNVLAITLEDIQKDLSPRIPEGSIKPLIESIKQDREALLAEVASNDRVFRDLSKSFMEGRSRIHTLPVQNNDFSAFSGGIRRMYRQARNYLEKSKSVADMHHLHDMRKRMKYLWYQVLVIKPVYPNQMKAMASSLESISEKLGVYHDLDVCSEFILDNDTGLETSIEETLLEACEFKKSSMLPGILKKSEAALSEEPKAFINRIGEYWKIYQRQPELSPNPDTQR
jgi:CHAD domain-containing protein